MHANRKIDCIKDFVRSRTQSSEKKYKSYKNKLTSILRKAKMDFYNKKLKEQRGNMKATWNILNSVIRSNF